MCHAISFSTSKSSSSTFLEPIQSKSGAVVVV